MIDPLRAVAQHPVDDRRARSSLPRLPADTSHIAMRMPCLLHDARHERRAVAVRRPEPRRARADARAANAMLRALELGVARVEPAPVVVVVRVVRRRGGRGGTSARTTCGSSHERLADDEERRVHVRGVEDAA